MKKYLLWAILVLTYGSTLCLAGGRFDPESFVREDLTRAAGNRHRYEALDSSVTKAPCGYEAFYISHIGRHGSRTNGSKDDYKIVEKMLEFKAQGAFTPEGEALLDAIQQIKAEVEKLGYGALTPRGASEHQAMARRMANHYPTVFTNPSKSNVKAYSTMVPRVIESMENFTGKLVSVYPAIKLSKGFSKENQHNKYEVNGQRIEFDKNLSSAFRHAKIKELDCNRLVRATFVNSVVPEAIKGHEASFFQSVYKAGCMRQTLAVDVEARLPRVEDYFTTEEILAFGEDINMKYFYMWSISEENGGAPAKGVDCIIRHIIEDADKVISGADTCATLRFSHDAYIMPVMAYFGLEGADFCGSYKDSTPNFCLAANIPMGGNIQIIFFRNAKGHVLVKFLKNEKETKIPALKASKKGIFYDWDVVKNYLENRF